MLRFVDASRPRLVLGAVVSIAACLTGCATRRLPAYEPPLARAEYQTIRTTAYTDTELDHVQYGARNALGGTLHAAAPPALPAPAPAAAGLAGPAGDVGTPAASPAGAYTESAAAYPGPLVYGSAAADWSRWPAGTVFRLLATGQLYRVDDYGWALSGRNTIDLYMPTRRLMNAWEVRREPIQILEWGDRDESLRILRRRDKYRHIRRMVLELEGKSRAAARME